ncbi:MAG: aminotransferase class III-fold pyridoxal phosphate-dependent enzyme, partial [Rhodocyclaceae bacterium]|nr:aminotransferase class III-fold pyridoxal phosphate-dependent enzyme [Rhodocyclaceae bacterium]
AVLFEPVQGEGGIRLAHPDTMRDLRRLCDERNWLFMVDEVQCGLARTGAWFAHQQAGVRADVMTLAKGLGGGVPIGACLTAGKAAGVFKPGNHGSTFGGNPLACVAALTTLEVIEQDGLMARAVLLGDRLRAEFKARLADKSSVVDIRGSGLMMGIELDRPCSALVQEALAVGLLINVTNDTVIRLLPPLVFSDEDAEELLNTLTPLIRQFLER